MKTKHVIAIGILSAIAVALLGIAVALGKTDKPKILQTKAQYSISDINIDKTTYNITGTPTIIPIGYGEAGGPQQECLVANIAYTINYANNTTTTTIVTKSFNYLDDVTSGYTETSKYKNDVQYTDTQTANIDIFDIQTIRISQLNFQRLIYNPWTYELNIRLTFFHISNTPNDEITHQFYVTIPDDSPLINESVYITDELTLEYIDLQSLNENIVTLIQDAEDLGESNGYQEGWADSDAFNHPIEIRTMMLEILTMPFTFITQAFNVTMWEGTAYAFNVATFIKSIIAIASIMFIIKLFTSGFKTLGNYTTKTNNKTESK